MKLAKALKMKNRLAGEIATAQKLFAASNTVEGDNKPAHDVHELYQRLAEKQNELVILKGKIARANTPISEHIFRMSELKARIAFLRSLEPKEGKFLLEGRYGTQPITREFHSTFTSTWIETEISRVSLLIEQLQDTVDEFNATTEI